MKFKILYILFLILLSAGAFAEDGPLYIQSANCEKDGSIKLEFDSFTTNKIYIEDIEITAEYIGDLIVKKNKFNITGAWNYDFVDRNKQNIFTSQETIFKLRGEYVITAVYVYNNIQYTLNYKLECPGFEFSCSLLGIYVDYCKNINNEMFEASARIYGLGGITKENLSLQNNIQFMLQAINAYEDYNGKVSDRGSLPKGVIISNPEYGLYYFNVSNFNNKINNFVAKIIGINHIEGGCVNYPNISLYSYKECKNVTVKEKKIEEVENEIHVTGQAIIEQETINYTETEINTRGVEKIKKPLTILIIVFGLCSLGILYIILKRNFNKGLNFLFLI